MSDQHDAFDIVRKRLLMRAEHRGIKEMDIILGSYVRAKLSDMSEGELTKFESFMEVDDQTLYAAITGAGAADAIEPVYMDIVYNIRQFINC